MKRGKYASSRLRHRLTLQQESRTPDGAGGYIRSWNDVANLWAEIIPLHGRERLMGEQMQPEMTHRMLIRYRDAVTVGQRLLFENRAFNIRSVVNLQENDDLLELMVEEGVAD